MLDLGCGHGRLGIEFARRGHRPVGTDLLPGFIERAWAEAARERLEHPPPGRMGDKVFEACGGQDSIATGCPTVNIGDGGSGGCS